MDQEYKPYNGDTRTDIDLRGQNGRTGGTGGGNASPPRGEERGQRAREKKPDAGVRGIVRFWRGIRPLVVMAVSLAICLAAFWYAYNILMEKLFYPVNIDDATPIIVTIPSNYGATAIARVLYEAGGVDDDGKLLEQGVISNKTLFKIYVDFTGKADKLRAGTYILSRNMDISQIVDVLCKGNPPRQTLRFTITEGMTVEEIADKLCSPDIAVLKTPDEFLSLCKTGEAFEENYSFIRDIPQNPEQARDYALEGYLFPDTYEIYADEAPKAIINRLLSRFLAVFSDDFRDKAQELGLSIDDVITLASVIEKEAKAPEDFAKVSAVFHTRLKLGMKLESDAPLRYIFKLNTLKFTSEQLSDPSLYNTYTNLGLPLGPISNPGRRAMEAALFPNEEFMEMSDKYIFFCLMDVETGALVYAKTLSEHIANVEKYSKDW